MSLPRRVFVLAGLTLAGSAVTPRLLVTQDRPRGSVEPPDPSGHELDVPLLRHPHAPSPSPARDARLRDLQFRHCLEQLVASATRLRDQMTGVSFSELLSVQIYRETQAMERLVKQLKSLAKS